MIRINLLPPEYRAQPAINPLRLLLLLVLVVIPLILAGMAAYCYYDLQSLSRSVEMMRIEREQYGVLYDKVLSMERTLAQVKAKLEAYEKLEESHLEAVDILMALNEVVPENVMINSLAVQGGGGITINGEATDYYGVAAFNLKLNLSANFSPAIMGTTSGSGDRYTYSFTTNYRPGASNPGNSAPFQPAPSTSGHAEVEDRGAAEPAEEAGGGVVH